MAKIMRGNCECLKFFKVQVAELLQKLFDWNQILRT